MVWWFARARHLYLSYLVDWIITFCFLAVFLILEYVVHPSEHQKWNRNDVAIMQPHIAKEDIPTWLLVVLTYVFPFVALSAYTLVRRDFVDFHFSILALSESWVISSFVVDFMKVLIGELRPDFLARCIPDPVEDICTNSDISLIRDGRKSFPSLHSSMSTAGLCFLSLYVAGKIYPYTDKQGYLAKIVATFLPSFLALYIGLSRIKDNQHFPIDVLFGFAIGLIVAYAAYRLHYPSFSHPQSGIPFYRLHKPEKVENMEKMTEEV